MKAAHVRIILLVKLGLLQKDTVVSVHKDSMERIANKVFQVSNYSLLFLIVFFQNIDRMLKYVNCVSTRRKLNSDFLIIYITFHVKFS